MSITQFTLRIFLLFFPGVLSSLFIDRTIVHKQWSPFQFAIHSFVLGTVSYLALFVVVAASTCSWPPHTSFLGCLSNDGNPINYQEVLYASGIALVLSILIIFLDKKKTIHRLLKRIGVTNKIGYQDIWAHTMDSDDIGWTVVRDIKNDLVFEGWISAFSETLEGNELLLQDVTVYRNTTSTKLYTTAAVYLSRPKDELTIEFPTLGDDRFTPNESLEVSDE